MTFFFVFFNMLRSLHLNSGIRLHLKIPYNFMRFILKGIFWFVSISFIIISSFSHQRKIVVFRRNLNDNMSPQVSWNLLRILVDFNNALHCMVCILRRISNSASLFSQSLVTVPGALTIIGITVAFMSHRFSHSLARSKYLFIFSLFFIFNLPLGTAAQFTK